MSTTDRLIAQAHQTRHTWIRCCLMLAATTILAILRYDLSHAQAWAFALCGNLMLLVISPDIVKDVTNNFAFEANLLANFNEDVHRIAAALPSADRTTREKLLDQRSLRTYDSGRLRRSGETVLRVVPIVTAVMNAVTLLPAPFVPFRGPTLLNIVMMLVQIVLVMEVSRRITQITSDLQQAASDAANYHDDLARAVKTAFDEKDRIDVE